MARKAPREAERRTEHRQANICLLYTSRSGKHTDGPVAQGNQISQDNAHDGRVKQDDGPSLVNIERLQDGDARILRQGDQEDDQNQGGSGPDGGNFRRCV